MATIKLQTMKIGVLDIDEYEKLTELAESVNLDEKMNFKCTFLAAKDDKGKILGVAGINFNFEIPKFIHIIVRKEYQNQSPTQY